VLADSISPDGRLAAAGGGNNNEIHVWELATGAPVKGIGSKPVVLRGTGAPKWAAGISADGQRIAWGNTWRTHSAMASSPLEHQLRLATDRQCRPCLRAPRSPRR
jgi:WD40 repeat protein